jgi:plastocyanin
MRDMPASFEPSNVTISAGDTVDWINVGNSVHHATDDRQMAIKADDVSSPPGGDSFDSGFLQPGEKFSHTFVKAGTYRYVCAAHETDGMVGEIRVNPR